MIDDVVAMSATGARPQIRRCIAVGNTKSGQIRNQLRSLGKGKISIKLQAVRRQRNARLSHRRRNHVTHQGRSSFSSDASGTLVYITSPGGRGTAAPASDPKLASRVNEVLSPRAHFTVRLFLPVMSYCAFPLVPRLSLGIIASLRIDSSSR